MHLKRRGKGNGRGVGGVFEKHLKIPTLRQKTVEMVEGEVSEKI